MADNEQRMHELEKFDHSLEVRLVKLETQQNYILSRVDETLSILKEHCNISPCDNCQNEHEIEKIKFNLRVVNWVGTLVTGSFIVSIVKSVWDWVMRGSN